MTMQCAEQPLIGAKGQEPDGVGKINSLVDSLPGERPPLSRVFFPLGFSVELLTNSPEVLSVAYESWGAANKKFDGPIFKFQLIVSGQNSVKHSLPPSYRSQGNLLSIIADANNFAICDLRGCFAFAELTSAVISDESYFRYFFLEAVVMCLLSSSCVTAVHAACVEHAGQGVLLCGDSGAGKSSLAYACARSGWTYISDDASYIVQNREDRLVLGGSGQVRFRPSASDLFPELKGLSITPRAAGKPSVEVPIATLLSDVAVGEKSQIQYIIFLNRTDRCVPGLIPLLRETAVSRLQHALFGTPEMQLAQKAALSRLLSTEIFELTYTSLEQAVSRLEILALEGK